MLWPGDAGTRDGAAVDGNVDAAADDDDRGIESVAVNTDGRLRTVSVQ